ncbi:Carboxypeptidase Q, partial [Armadillidium nasatum]
MKFLSFAIFLFLELFVILPSKNNAISQEEVKSILSYFQNERNNFARTATHDNSLPHDLKCKLDQAIIDEIHSYQGVVNAIIELFTKGEFAGKTYEYLAEMTDTFGPRITGSQALEDAIDWVISTASSEGMTVYTENVTAPFFVRNEESLKMVKPRSANMKLIGLGSTVPTPNEGITADVLVVSSFDELTALADKAVGKIVVYDVPFVTYGKTVEYRSRGAVEAAKVGAVAALLRSVTTFSIDSPHTGTQFYSDNVPKIPAACITIEDSTFMHRLQDRGERITLHLYLGAQNYENGTQTRNTIIEIEGSQNPEEIVVVSGHLDSWDVGVGAMDDGGGCFISWMALRAIQKLNLTPRRTFRAILFSAEEQGMYGGDAYFLAHGTQKENFQLMMESDFGTFKPHGIFFSGTDEATCMMKEIVSLTALLGTTQLSSPADTPDLETFGEVGVPRGSLMNENDHYIWYHHSSGDRIDVYNSTHLDEVAALWTAVSYVAADVTFFLPQ